MKELRHETLARLGSPVWCSLDELGHGLTPLRCVPAAANSRANQKQARWRSSEGGLGEGEDRRASAGRDDNDAEVGGAGIADGGMDVCVEFAVAEAQQKRVNGVG